MDLRRPFVYALPFALLLGCFEEPEHTSTMTSAAGTGDTTGDPDGESGGTEGDGDGDGDGDPTGDGDGDPTGPQLLSSVPVDGATEAQISGLFSLQFDRPVSAADGIGKIVAIQAGGRPTPVVVSPCSNADPACLLGKFPDSMLIDGQLPSSTDHEIVIQANFPDTEGVVNDVDQGFGFTTFIYDSEWLSDPGLSELWGIALDANTDALLLSGLGENPSGPTVRRVTVTDGVPGIPTTIAMPVGNGPVEGFGLDFDQDRVFVSLGPSALVAELIIDGPDATAGNVFESPSLAAPYDVLLDVQSIALDHNDGRLFFGFGQSDGPDRVGIVARTAQGNWSVFQTGDNLWDQDPAGMVVAIGEGSEYLFAHNHDTIYQLRTSDGSLVQKHQLEFAAVDAHLLVDGAGFVWFGSNSGLLRFGVSDSGFTEVARRDGLEASRFTIASDNGAVVDVYYGRLRGNAMIGHTQITF